MKKKIFVVSDIHGHYTELINSLNEVGFDETNDKHLLISLGDMFDRGSESYQVYKYLKKLADTEKVICLKGNHEPMFTSWLLGDNDNFNYKYNGTKETIDDFLHSTSDFHMYLLMYSSCTSGTGLKPGYTYGDVWKRWCDISRKQIRKENPELVNWLTNLPYYFETKNYIFTHASIDLNSNDWHNPLKSWHDLTWDDGSFVTHQNNLDKTIVVGHFGTGHLRDMWQIDTKDKNDYSILKTEDNKVFIDGCTILTKKVNVYVIEDELID